MIKETKDFNTDKFLWKSFTPRETVVYNPTLIPAQRVFREKRHLGGILDKHGNEVEDGRMWRERGPNKETLYTLSLDNRPINKSATNVIHGDYYYLGGIFDQYGHFLLESLSRVPMERAKRKKALYFPLYPNRIQLEHVDYSFKALGIPKRPITEVTKINGSITVPYPRTAIGSHYDESQREIITEIRDYVANKRHLTGLPKKLYLSRSRLHKDDRKISNETEIERHLKKRGFTICHMQEMSFEDQILHMINADVVVGFMGSAMHSLIFSNIDTNAVFLYDSSGPFIAKNYISCDKMLGRTSIYVDISEITMSTFGKTKVDIKKLMNSLDKVL